MREASVQNGISRRAVLKTSAVAVTVATLGGRMEAAEAESSSSRVLRFAHPTDIHVEPELRGAQGMAAAYQHMMALKDPPQLILNGGDLPMDTASTGQARSAMLWKLYKKILADNVPADMPMYYAVGNHDIWGRDRAACGATGKEPFFGKRWFLDEFAYGQTYHSFDRAGWHFVILDSFDLDAEGSGYTSRIVGDQLEWFKNDLKNSAAMPTVVVTHVPIISVANFFDREAEVTDQDIRVSRMRMHVDFAALSALFRKHPQVKLCLSGHLHLLDRVEYDGVTYICDGAVCGDKWRGPRLQTREGYGLVDLFADGTFVHQYRTYGWHVERA